MKIPAQALAGAWLQALSARPFVLLESPGLQVPKRLSLLAGEPLFVLEGRGARAWLKVGSKRHALKLSPGSAFAKIGQCLARRRSGPSFWPLITGLSYEAGARLQGVPLAKPEPVGLPDWYAFLPGLWLEGKQGSWKWNSQSLPMALGRQLAYSLGLKASALHSRLDPGASKRQLQNAIASYRLGPPAQAVASGPLRDSMGEQGFAKRVGRIREHILDGDVYQVNLGHRFECRYQGEAFDLYRRLTGINPSPMAAYADLGSAQVVSASPERLFRVEGRSVETWPIAGTAPNRGKKGERQALRHSAKDAAEHVMLVDLERNDLGRVCVAGSVRVPRFKRIESNANVHHLVSQVTGKLLPGMGLPQLLQAGFPGGSITGAPKIRCMQITRELEGQRRGWYTGSLGWWEPKQQRADLNILIRTLYVKKKKAYGSLGAGIVLDSKPKKEWDETLAKGKALFQALGRR